MTLHLKIEFDKDVTAYGIESALDKVFEIAKTAALSNAERTTVSFDDKKPVFTLELDDEVRETLRLDCEQALEVLTHGDPCQNCKDDGVCFGLCQNVSQYESAKRTALEYRAFCTTECDQYRDGTCQFVFNKKDCPKYK